MSSTRATMPPRARTRSRCTGTGRRTNASVAADQLRDLDLVAAVLDIEPDGVADDHDDGADQQHRRDQHTRGGRRRESPLSRVDPLRVELHEVDSGRAESLGLQVRDLRRSWKSAAGRTTSVCGSGLSLSASSASPKAGSLRNSLSASSAGYLRRSATSRSCLTRSASARARRRAVAGLKYTEKSSDAPPVPARSCAFWTSTCRHAGSASAMPMTRIVSSAVASGWRLRLAERRRGAFCRCRVEPARS